MSRTGFFLTLEGGEGSGKSTLGRALADTLAAEGVAVCLTREPGGSAGAEDIRALLVSGEADRWDAMTELLLLNAARRDHVERVIRPALARGETVICDRYLDSTRAYQGHRGIERERIDRLHGEAVGLMPDRTLILDLDPEAGLARAGKRGGAARFEAMGLDYHRAIRGAFRAIAAEEPARCTLLDASLAPEAVLERARAALAG